MISINTREAVEQVRRNFSHLTRGEQKLATIRALNRTAFTARTELRKQIRKMYDLPAAHIQKTSVVITAKGNSLTAQIIVKGWPTPLAFMKPNQTRDGVTVRIKKQRVLIKKAVIKETTESVNDGTGEKVVAKQVKSRGRYTSAGFKPNSRDKLSRLNTLSTAAASAKPETVAAVAKRINEYFPTRLAHEMANVARRIK